MVFQPSCMFPFLQDLNGGRKFKLSVRKIYDHKKHALQSNKTTTECSSLDKLGHAFAGSSKWCHPYQVNDECSKLVLVKLTTQGLEATGAKVMYSIAVRDDFTYNIHVREKSLILSNTPALKELSKTLSTTSALSEVMKTLDSTKLCIGNQHHKYHTLKGWKGPFLDWTGKLLTVELHVHTANMQ